MIREAAKCLMDGFCKTKDVKRYVKTRWDEDVSSQSIWNVLGSERSRILNSVNGKQRQKARELLESVYEDKSVAIQLIKLEGVKSNEEV